MPPKPCWSADVQACSHTVCKHQQQPTSAHLPKPGCKLYTQPSDGSTARCLSPKSTPHAMGCSSPQSSSASSGILQALARAPSLGARQSQGPSRWPPACQQSRDASIIEHCGPVVAHCGSFGCCPARSCSRCLLTLSVLTRVRTPLAGWSGSAGDIDSPGPTHTGSRRLTEWLAAVHVLMLPSCSHHKHRCSPCRKQMQACVNQRNSPVVTVIVTCKLTGHTTHRL